MSDFEIPSLAGVMLSLVGIAIFLSVCVKKKNKIKISTVFADYLEL